IKLVLVTEAHRFKREVRFACLAHRLNLRFEALRGGYRAKLTGSVYLNWYADNYCSSDTGYKGICLGSLGADADGVGLGSNTLVSYIDIIVASGQIATGEIAQCDVLVAGCVIQERVGTVGRVVGAGCVAKERKITNCRIVVGSCVGKEC